MNDNLWWLLSVALLGAAAIFILFWCWRRWRRKRRLAQAEEANRLCRAYCDLILSMKADPFNVSLCQKFLVCALAYYGGENDGRITAEVEQMIMRDLMLAGVRCSAMFEKPSDEKPSEPQVRELGSVPSVS